MLQLLVSVAFGGDCAPVTIEGASVQTAGATAMVVRGVEGGIELVGSEGSEVVASGTACHDVTVKLVRKQGVIEARVSGARDADLSLKLAVPSAIGTLSVQDQLGPLQAHDLSLKLAVISSTGPVEVRAVDTVRVAYLTGPLVASGIKGDVVVDHVTGPVTVDDVDGSLAVAGSSGPVNQSNVRGQVSLP
jgi:hypothetical protein